MCICLRCFPGLLINHAVRVQIEEVKSVLMEKEGIDKKQLRYVSLQSAGGVFCLFTLCGAFRLIYRGKQLNDEATLESAHVKGVYVCVR